MGTPGPETRIKNKIKDWLREEGIWELKVHGSEFQRAGIPDFLLCVQGMFVALEVKQPGEEPTRLQQEEIKRICQSGGLAKVVTSLEQAQQVVGDVRFQRNYERAALAHMAQEYNYHPP